MLRRPVQRGAGPPFRLLFPFPQRGRRSASRRREVYGAFRRSNRGFDAVLRRELTTPRELSELQARLMRQGAQILVNSIPRTGRSACRLISWVSRVTGDDTGPAGTAPCFASGSSRETSPPISRLGCVLHFGYKSVKNYFLGRSYRPR